jgi:formylglycine-generating enzyme required for sulfatase activity
MTINTRKIFLASSSELKEDRKEFEIFISRRNKAWVSQGVYLELVQWEDFLDALSQTRLQDEYNKAIKDCDLFVMLFFTKVGQYTAEEFETAFGQFKATNKPFIFTYFKDADISTGNANKKDLMSLWTFQEKLDDLGHFYTRYKNIDELKLHFSQQLDKLAANGFIELLKNENGISIKQAELTGSGSIAQGEGDAMGAGAVKVTGDVVGNIISGTQIINHYHGASEGQGKAEIARQVAGYLLWLRERTSSIELRGIEKAGGAPVVQLPLETAYVPLRAKAMPRLGEEPRSGTRLPSPMREPSDDVQSKESDNDIALNEVLGLGNRLVIIGGSGCGKTTVMLHMAWALAASLLAGQNEPARSRLGLGLPPDALPLPILVPLASFARYRRNLAHNTPAREKSLSFFISHHLISKDADFDLPADFFVKLLTDGRNVMLLLDGLDEVANEDERAEVRQSVDELVAGRSALRVVVTCRTIAYRSGRTALGADFREISVCPLDRELHVKPMITQAYACIHPHDTALRIERIKDLLNGIDRLEAERRVRLGEDAAAFVDSPLMVRLLLIVHVNNRTLPDERAELFDKAINALLQVDYGREESNIRELSTDWKLYRDMAQHLAFSMHRQGKDQGREIEEPALIKALRTEAEFLPRIDGFLVHARQRGSVLEERDRAYRFIHLAFQEFLTARHILKIIGAEGREAMLASLETRLEDPWWREPILLLASYMGSDAAKSAREFIAGLSKLGKAANAQFSAAELAATAALEWRESGDALKADCAKRIVELLGDGDSLNNSKPVIRARAGDRLAQLGDPRFDPQRFYLPNDDLLGFVHIPADPDFIIGTRSGDFDRVMEAVGVLKDHIVFSKAEINDQPTPTREFYIARYPVTVAQFRAFVEATGFKLGNEKALRDPDSRPMRWVSWREAREYCRWLNGVLQTSTDLASCELVEKVRGGHWHVTLPSELEWEKAARGGLVGAIFPWGDGPDPNRANYFDSNIVNTSAVGCFPPNDYGLYDMVGNLLELTRTLWGFDYPYPLDDLRREDLKAGNDKSRVTRGGSWLNNRGGSSCAVRGGYWPIFRSDYVGFRVVLRSAPVV